MNYHSDSATSNMETEYEMVARSSFVNTMKKLGKPWP